MKYVVTYIIHLQHSLYCAGGEAPNVGTTYENMFPPDLVFIHVCDRQRKLCQVWRYMKELHHNSAQ